LDLRHLGIREQRLDLVARQDCFWSELVRERRVNDSRNMIAVFMSNDDCPGAADRMLDLFCRFRIVRLDHASSEKVVDVLVHTRVAHDVAVGIYHLKDGQGLNARLIRRTYDGKSFGDAALGKLENVDALWGPTRNDSV